MAGFLDDVPIEFTCPNCSQEICETIGRLKNGVCRCSGCNALFDAEQFADEIRRLEEDFDRGLDGIGDSIG